MSVIDEIKEIEQGLVDKRYDEAVMETARSVQHFFQDLEDAAEYAQAYEQTYNRGNQFFDPEGYAESWYENFNGDMTGITEELMYED